MPEGGWGEFPTPPIFAEAGADIPISDLVDEDGELEAAAIGIQAYGRRDLTIQADVSKKVQVVAMVERVCQYGCLYNQKVAVSDIHRVPNQSHNLLHPTPHSRRYSKHDGITGERPYSNGEG